MRWYTVLESLKGESSTHGRANARIFFFFPSDMIFLSFSPMKLISASHYNNLLFCSIFVHCIIMLLKPMLARRLRSFRNWDNKYFLGFFLKTPHAVDIAVIISSLIASLCFTFAKPFDIFLFVKSSCACIGQWKYKQKFTTQGRK